MKHRIMSGDGVIIVRENRALVNEVLERRQATAEFGNDLPWRTANQSGLWPWARRSRPVVPLS